MAMSAPVSVVIPCYHCASTIARTVESVAQQTLRPAEVILVDDGSGDETGNTLDALQRTFGEDWLKVISFSSNRGVSVARNSGWDAATHKYVAFLDADDIWHPQKIELQFGWMQNHPDILMSGHRYRIVVPDAPLPPLTTDAGSNPSPITRNRLLRSNPFVTPAVMLKRDLPYRFDPTRRYCEDYFLWLQLACDGLTLMMLEIPLVYVRKQIGQSGASRHLLKMRLGDIENYWRLWQMGKLNFFLMCFYVGLSVLKFLLLLAVGPQTHFTLKQRVDSSGSK